MSTASTLVEKDFGITAALERLGIKEINNGASTGTKWLPTNGDIIESYSPADGKLIGKIKQATAADYEQIITLSQAAFEKWKTIKSFSIW